MSNPEKGNQLDLSSEAPQSGRVGQRIAEQQLSDTARRFLGVRFVCCDMYSRIYINKKQTAYVGNCPKCAKQVHMRIAEGGSDARFFEVG